MVIYGHPRNFLAVQRANSENGRDTALAEITPMVPASAAAFTAAAHGPAAPKISRKNGCRRRQCRSRGHLHSFQRGVLPGHGSLFAFKSSDEESGLPMALGRLSLAAISHSQPFY